LENKNGWGWGSIFGYRTIIINSIFQYILISISYNEYNFSFIFYDHNYFYCVALLELNILT
ncbi:MAG: hypothetical protein ACK56F_33180, partial [bacterium]